MGVVGSSSVFVCFVCVCVSYFFFGGDQDFFAVRAGLCSVYKWGPTMVESPKGVSCDASVPSESQTRGLIPAFLLPLRRLPLRNITFVILWYFYVLLH